MMTNKWQIYDELIEGIPQDIIVTDLLASTSWTMVENERGIGIGLTVRQRAGSQIAPVPITGAPLRDIAALVKSWYMIEASIGMAAINSWYNRPERTRAMGLVPENEADRKKNDAVATLMEEMPGKKVCVIGHFPEIEKRIAGICDLSILEREPNKGDYPDSACEYILEDQDIVLITGMTLINKTLPRLLELIRTDATVCMLGPSVPLSDTLAKYGVNRLSGYTATDTALVKEAVKRGVKQEIFRYGYMCDYAIG